MDVARETYLIKIKADSSFDSEYIPDPENKVSCCIKQNNNAKKLNTTRNR